MINIISSPHMVSLTKNIFPMFATLLCPLNSDSMVRLESCRLLFAKLLQNFQNASNSQVNMFVDIKHTTHHRNL